MSVDNRSFTGPWNLLPVEPKEHFDQLLHPAYDAVAARRDLVIDPARSYLPKPLVSVQFEVGRLYYDNQPDASKRVRVARLRFGEPFEPLLEDVVSGWGNPMEGATGDRRIVYYAKTPTGGLFWLTQGLQSYGELVAMVTRPIMDRDVVRNAQYGQGSELFFPDTPDIPVEARVGRFFHTLTQRKPFVTSRVARASEQQLKLLGLSAGTNR